jgi:hypothetical protein
MKNCNYLGTKAQRDFRKPIGIIHVLSDFKSIILFTQIKNFVPEQLRKILFLKR